MMNNKTKILFILPGFSLGGTTTALASLLNSGLVEHFDIDVFAITRMNYSLQPVISHDIGLNELTTAYYGSFSQFSIKDKLKYLFVKLLKRNGRLLTKLEYWVINRTVRKIERHKKYDVIVGFQEGLTSRFASRFSCPHKIAWIHCDYANTYGEEVNELSLYNHFEKIVCVSQFTCQNYIGRYPALSDKTVAIHNIFDSESVVRRSKDDIDDDRFDISHFTIISLGRVHDVKRFYLIPEIAAQLKDAGLDFRWYILGSSGIPNELKRLTDAIRQHSVENEVIYLGGKSNPYPYLKAANLMVTISKSEACPMIFNEAKILHVPVLSSDFGSAFEFIEQGKDGYISSLENLPQKLLDLANNPDMLASMRNNQVICDNNSTIIGQLTELFTF